MNLRNSALMLGALGLLAACGGDNSAPPIDPRPEPIPTTANVQATPAIAFSPNSVAIQLGGTVTIAFGAVAHNVFFDNGPAGAPPNIDGENANVSKSLTFATAGTFVYNCHIHPGMHGTVIVVDPNE